MRAKTFLLIIILAGYGYYVRSMTVQVMSRVDAVGKQYSAAMDGLSIEQSGSSQLGLTEYVANK